TIATVARRRTHRRPAGMAAACAAVRLGGRRHPGHLRHLPRPVGRGGHRRRAGMAGGGPGHLPDVPPGAAVVLPAGGAGPGAAAAMLTALVLAARFPLAYAAGRAIAGPRAGLWALALMAVPGWWVLALGVVTHTAATEAAVLWLVVATLAAMRRPNAGRQLWL